jgi:hypothetical protein
MHLFDAEAGIHPPFAKKKNSLIIFANQNVSSLEMVLLASLAKLLCIVVKSVYFGTN